MKTLTVIPAFNEAESVADVIAEVLAARPRAPILVVDDGSSDQTAMVAERAGAFVICLPFNLGVGAATQTGILYALEAGHDSCVIIDADGQHDPAFVSSLLAPIEAGEADIVIGSRFLTGAGYSVPLLRRLGIAGFRWLASMIVGKAITDPTSGFRAINKRLMEFLVRDNYPADYPDADTIIRLHFAGFRIGEVPVKMRPRLRGVSQHKGLSVAYYFYKMTFSMLIALTQRRVLKEGGANAIRNEAIDRLR